jgi:hypothetical protein
MTGLGVLVLLVAGGVAGYCLARLLERPVEVDVLPEFRDRHLRRIK